MRASSRGCVVLSRSTTPRFAVRCRRGGACEMRSPHEPHATQAKRHPTLSSSCRQKWLFWTASRRRPRRSHRSCPQSSVLAILPARQVILSVLVHARRSSLFQQFSVVPVYTHLFCLYKSAGHDALRRRIGKTEENNVCAPVSRCKVRRK